MNITNLEMAQASVEIFCALSFVMGAVMLHINKVKMESSRIFQWMFVTAAIAFCMDACAYIFRGNTDLASVIMTRESNFIVFSLEMVLANLFVRYVYSILLENGVQVEKCYQHIVNILLLTTIVILLVNIVNGWMYSFDEQNNYYRNQMWYAYVGLAILTILIGLFISVKYRKYMKKSRLISIVLFALIPLVTGIIQVFYYGISFTNIGLALGIWIVFITYIISYVKNNDAIEEEKNDRIFRSMIILFLMMVFVMSISIISCISSIQRICKEKSEQDSLLVAHMISDQIQSEFIKPITVSQTISRDYELIANIEASGADGAESVEAAMTVALDYLRRGFDYQMVFAVCDNNKAYYTFDGLKKYIDPQNDPEDNWYQKFIDSGNEYLLEIKKDESNNQKLAVFINQMICDEKGNFIGVCGVSIGMDKIQNAVLKLEKDNDVKIDLVDENGIIQLDSITDNIGKVIDKFDCDQINSTQFYYSNLGNRSRMTMYMKQLGWYLVITDYDPIKINSNEITVPSIIIFIGGLCLLALTFSLVALKEQKMRNDLVEKRRMSITDELTGLLNRRAYEDTSQTLQREQNFDNLVIVMIDVNGLKNINDNLGHRVGDELIISAAKCIHTAFSKYGKIYRIGGDEFVAVLRCSRKVLEDSYKTLQYLVSNWNGEEIKGFSVSKGAAFHAEHPEYTFEKLQELADQCMYKEKEEYYKKMGKVRRGV